MGTILFSSDEASHEAEASFETHGFDEETVKMPKEKAYRGQTIQSEKDGKNHDKPGHVQGRSRDSQFCLSIL